MGWTMVTRRRKAMFAQKASRVVPCTSSVMVCSVTVKTLISLATLPRRHGKYHGVKLTGRATARAVASTDTMKTMMSSDKKAKWKLSGLLSLSLRVGRELSQAKFGEAH